MSSEALSSIPCTVVSNPLANVTWYKIVETNTTADGLETKLIYIAGGIGSNELKTEVRDDTRQKYLCRAINKHGKDEKIVLVSILFPRKFIHNCFWHFLFILNLYVVGYTFCIQFFSSA